MPYIMGGARGILIVNKKAAVVDVTLKGATGGQVTVVEVAVSGPVSRVAARPLPGCACAVSAPVSTWLLPGAGVGQRSLANNSGGGTGQALGVHAG